MALLCRYGTLGFSGFDYGTLGLFVFGYDTLDFSVCTNGTLVFRYAEMTVLETFYLFIYPLMSSLARFCYSSSSGFLSIHTGG